MAQGLRISDHLVIGCSVRVAWSSTLHMELTIGWLNPVLAHRIRV